MHVHEGIPLSNGVPFGAPLPRASTRVALVIHGRFHGFDLFHGLREQGASPHLFTNYPAWAVRKLGGIAPEHVTSCWRHGVALRMAERLPARFNQEWIEPWAHQWFGRWAERVVQPDAFDMIHSWSGISEELFTKLNQRGQRPLTTLLRGSAHIETQHEILQTEEQRCGVAIDRPSAWIRERESREYELSDFICCLSSFARQSFLDQGVAAERMAMLPLGVRVDRFRSSPEVLAQRRERVLRGEPLRVLMVGTLSFRKGLLDLAEVVRRLSGRGFEFRFVGDVPPEGRRLAASLESQMSLIGRVPQTELVGHYGWADLFLFPTLEDGFAAVLSQALAAGLPLIATPNCSAPDLITDGEQGWLVPIRQPEAIIERLTWCDQHRAELAEVLDQVTGTYRNRAWSEVAAEYLSLGKDRSLR